MQNNIEEIEKTIKENQAVMIYFSAPTCNVCHALKPKLLDAIESNFGEPLTWERLDGQCASRIKAESPGNVFDKDKWEPMFEFMVTRMVKLEKALRGPLNEVRAQLKNRH